MDFLEHLDITKYTDEELSHFLDIQSKKEIPEKIERFEKLMLDKAKLIFSKDDEKYKSAVKKISTFFKLANEKLSKKTAKDKFMELYAIYEKDLKTATSEKEREQKRGLYRSLFELLAEKEVPNEFDLLKTETSDMVPNSYLDKTEQPENTIYTNGTPLGAIDEQLNKMREFLIQNPQLNEYLHNPNVLSFGGTPVINRIQTPYNLVSNASYIKGVLNPIDRHVTKKIINLDTTFCHKHLKEGSSTSSFIYTLPEPLNNVLTMRLASAEIPNTWYLFDNNTRSNEMIIRVYIPSALQNALNVHQTTPFGNELQTFKISLPEGTWDISELINSFNRFTANNRYIDDLGNNFYTNLSFLVMSINETDSKTVIRFRSQEESESVTSESANAGRFLPLYDPITQSANYALAQQAYFELDFILPDDRLRDLRKNLGWSLGFRKAYYKVYRYDNAFRYFFDIKNTEYDVLQIPLTYYFGSITSETVYGANKYNYLFLSVNDFVGNHGQDIVSCFEENLMATDLLARIAVRYGSFTVNIDDSSDLVHRDRHYFGPVTIEKLEIKLLDKFGDLINLNGADYSLMLEFTLAYS
jgi:hypothetical protein